jgi:sorting nexin-9/18/33
MKVQVLYDFDAQPGTSELTVYAGQVLDITRQDIGEGWWEGRNEHGDVGLFPAAYVQELTATEPPAGPPPPLPNEYASPGQPGDAWKTDSWGNTTAAAPQTYANQAHQPTVSARLFIRKKCNSNESGS